MNEVPIARHFIACENVAAAAGARRYTLTDIVLFLYPLPGGTFPLRSVDLGFWVLLTNGRGSHEVSVEQRIGVGPASRVLWRSRSARIELGDDPLALVGLPIHFRGLQFPEPGQYEFDLLCDGTVLASEWLEARGRRDDAPFA